MENQARIRLIWPKTGRDWLAFLLILGLILGLVGNLLPKGQKEVQAGSVRLKVPQGWEVQTVCAITALGYNSPQMPPLLLTAHPIRERHGIHRNTPRAWERHKVSRFAARTRARRRKDAQGQGQER